MDTDQPIHWRKPNAFNDTETGIIALSGKHTDFGLNIRLSLSRFQATENRKGTIFVLPDDPGASSILNLPNIANSLPDHIRRHYDIIAVDHRFSGQSDPISFNVSQEETLWVFRKGHSLEEDRDFQKHLATRAYQTFPAVARSITSYNIVEDLAEVLANWSSEETVYLFGQSYGGYIASALMTKYPTLVSGAIIDGAINPDWVWRPLFTNYANDCDIAIRQFEGEYLRQLHPSLFSSSDNIFDILHSHLTFATHSPVRIGTEISVSDDMLRMIIMLLSSSESFWPTLASLLESLTFGGDTDKRLANILGQLFSSHKAQGSTYAQLALLANDAEWPRDNTVYKRDMNEAEGHYNFLGNIMARPKATTFWPWHGSPTLEHGTQKSAKVLILQPEYNMFTPLRSAQRLKRLWKNNAALIVLEDLSETRSFPQLQSAAIANIVSAYLEDPSSISDATVTKSELF